MLFELLNINNNNIEFDSFNFLLGLILFTLLYILPYFKELYTITEKYNIYYYEIISYIYSAIHAIGISIITVLYLFGYLKNDIFIKSLYYSGSYFIVDIIYIILYYIVDNGYNQEKINKLLRKNRNFDNNTLTISQELTTLRSNNNKLYYNTIGYIIHHISAILGYLLIIYEVNIFNDSINIYIGQIKNNIDNINTNEYNRELLFEKYIIGRLLLSEITTPFLNFCWFLKQIHLDNTQIMINMFSFTLILYSTFRIINFIQILYIIIINLYILQCLIILPIIYMNFNWFHKLCIVLYNKIDI